MPSPAIMEFRRRITAGLRVTDKPDLRVIEGGAGNHVGTEADLTT